MLLYPSDFRVLLIRKSSPANTRLQHVVVHNDVS